jgi:predicted nucleic acid-binding protein
VSVVVDASVATKWVIAEIGSDRANELRTETELIAPSLIAAEIGSALWKAVRRGDVARTDALLAIRAVLLPFDTIVANEELHERALQIAIELRHPIYDCFYLALAERERAPLVTADGRLLAAAKKAKVTAKKL